MTAANNEGLIIGVVAALAIGVIVSNSPAVAAPPATPPNTVAPPGTTSPPATPPVTPPATPPTTPLLVSASQVQGAYNQVQAYAAQSNDAMARAGTYPGLPSSHVQQAVALATAALARYTAAANAGNAAAQTAAYNDLLTAANNAMQAYGEVVQALAQIVQQQQQPAYSNAQAVQAEIDALLAGAPTPVVTYTSTGFPIYSNVPAGGEVYTDRFGRAHVLSLADANQLSRYLGIPGTLGNLFRRAA